MEEKVLSSPPFINSKVKSVIFTISEDKCEWDKAGSVAQWVLGPISP